LLGVWPVECPPEFPPEEPDEGRAAMAVEAVQRPGERRAAEAAGVAAPAPVSAEMMGGCCGVRGRRRGEARAE